MRKSKERKQHKCAFCNTNKKNALYYRDDRYYCNKKHYKLLKEKEVENGDK